MLKFVVWFEFVKIPGSVAFKQTDRIKEDGIRWPVIESSARLILLEFLYKLKTFQLLDECQDQLSKQSPIIIGLVVLIVSVHVMVTSVVVTVARAVVMVTSVAVTVISVGVMEPLKLSQ